MKKIIFMAAALFTCVIASAEMTLDLELTNKAGETIKTVKSACVINDETLYLSTEHFEIAITAQPVDIGCCNDVELSFAIARKNEDGSFTLISKPIVRTAFNQEAQLTISSGNDQEETLSLVCTVKQTDAEPEAEPMVEEVQ